jgi:DNA-binding transcriptional LysR family regulator
MGFPTEDGAGDSPAPLWQPNLLVGPRLGSVFVALDRLVGQRCPRILEMRVAHAGAVLPGHCDLALCQRLEQHPKPLAPRDLLNHNCLRYRRPWDGAILPWTFGRGRQQRKISVDGSLTVNDLDLLVSAALDGVGIAYLPEQMAAPYLAAGRLVTVAGGLVRRRVARGVPVLSEPPADAGAAESLCRVHQETAQARSGAAGAAGLRGISKRAVRLLNKAAASSRVAPWLLPPTR